MENKHEKRASLYFLQKILHKITSTHACLFVLGKSWAKITLEKSSVLLLLLLVSPLTKRVPLVCVAKVRTPRLHIHKKARKSAV